MSVEYLGKVNNIVTVEKLKELTGMTIGNYNSGDITFLKFNDNGKELLVADRCIANSTSWNVLDGCGVVSGKVISVNKSKYICRLITGGDGNASVEDNSEWKRLIVDIVPNTSDSNWKNMNTICQETYYGNSSQCIIRGGYTSVSSGGPVSKTANPNDVGWRPVFEKYENISITGINDDLGEISSFNGLRYNIVNNYDTNFNLTEKVDGQVIRNLNNQSNGEFTFNIENFDSLTYGNHTIEVIVDDPTASGNVTVASKFNKIKSPVQPMPTNSNLKQVMLHNKELEKEISYQNFRLSEKLKDNGVEVADAESLSSLISKTSNIGLNFVKQSGVVSAGGNQTIDINISPVDLSKSICWCRLKYNPTNNLAARYFVSKFKTSSVLELSRLIANSTFDVYWEVLEFRSGIKGIYNKLIKGSDLIGFNNSLMYKTINHGFNISNPDKCLVYLSFTCSYDNNDVFVDIRNLTKDSFDVVWNEVDSSRLVEINVYIVELL